MDQRKLIILGCLLVLLTSGILRWYTDNLTATTNNQRSPNLLPDSVVYNLKQQHFNDQGQLAYNMQAKHANQFEAKAVSQLDSLSITLFNTGIPDWHASAQTGLTANNGELIELSGDVIIQQDKITHENPTTLSTISLLLSPKKEYAETQEPVTIQQGTSVTHAVGMNVDTRAGKIILLSNVKSRYETIP
ncbi:LPS export ABC transporter periplasmic protein LptC [Gammaproteobacteria bacterium 42_54_T18]|nr:LPS export ABC transporter periplasmic protein LptC [Gammaproteobacteria bacterium 42_54_T18]